MQSAHAKKLKVGGLIVAAGTLPLLVYVLLGPKDGNPVGLGILMWLSWLMGGALLIWGTIGTLVSHLRK